LLDIYHLPLPKELSRNHIKMRFSVQNT
jgi:hypothetical protein